MAGHSGNKWNDYVDELAARGRQAGRVTEAQTLPSGRTTPSRRTLPTRKATRREATAVPVDTEQQAAPRTRTRGKMRGKECLD